MGLWGAIKMVPAALRPLGLVCLAWELSPVRASYSVSQFRETASGFLPSLYAFEPWDNLRFFLIGLASCGSPLTSLLGNCASDFVIVVLLHFGLFSFTSFRSRLTSLLGLYDFELSDILRLGLFNVPSCGSSLTSLLGL